MRYEIRELSLGGVLDQAVTLTKNHFGLLLGVTLVLQVPFGLAQGFVQLAVTKPLPAQPTMDDILKANQENLQNLVITGPLLLLAVLIVFPLTNAALIHAVAHAYLEKPISVGAAFRSALGRILPLVGTWFLVYLAVLGGMILCFIPGILFAFWFSLATQIVVIEGIAGTAACSRSKALVKGNIGTLFVLFLLLGFIGGGIGGGSAFIPQQHLQVAAMVLGQAVAGVFGAAAIVVFYFSCRCKHENFDLTLLAEAIGEESPAHDDAAYDAEDSRRFQDP